MNQANDWYGYLGMGLGMLLAIIVGVLLIVLIIQLFKNYQLKTKTAVEIARDEAYRKLSEQSLAVQEETSKKLGILEQKLAQMDTELKEVHRMIKEVE
ncbi:hypothetical protein SAMN05444392_104147 [Seinonella peptonophila]|uniref:Uncharacterized protein n=1 Tax=Seinonella peptonophila TaxID=112248 RepID=A0A1M4X657_9BACL|nr:hypothetical protein [Seinonella peptonophila]SHE88970.1 hypothetical protein SAMN05444392_104147 [Seinonella peptonophila]